MRDATDPRSWDVWEEAIAPGAYDDIAATYHRVTGKDFAELDPGTQRRFRFLPPDADQSDIDFCIDPPPQAPRYRSRPPRP
jgi:hypothetical protein